jgi:hypothetical protein
MNSPVKGKSCLHHVPEPNIREIFVSLIAGITE